MKRNKRTIYELKQEIKAVEEISCICGNFPCEEFHNNIEELLKKRRQERATNYFFIKTLNADDTATISILKPKEESEILDEN